MIYFEWIIIIASAIGAIITIWKAIVFLVHLADDIKEIKQHTKENYLSGLRLTIMAPYMPIGERIIAGDDYLKAGGNGEVKAFIKNKLKANEVLKDEKNND